MILYLIKIKILTNARLLSVRALKVKSCARHCNSNCICSDLLTLQVQQVVRCLSVLHKSLGVRKGRRALQKIDNNFTWNGLDSDKLDWALAVLLRSQGRFNAACCSPVKLRLPTGFKRSRCASAITSRCTFSKADAIPTLETVLEITSIYHNPSVGLKPRSNGAHTSRLTFYNK